MGNAAEPVFCCGACEHVAYAASQGRTHTFSPAAFVSATNPGLAMVAWRGGATRRIPLTRGMRVSIGSDPICDVCLEDPTLSRRTCELSVDDGGEVFIADLMSVCGTVVNDARIDAPYRLHERDLIRIGSTLMLFEGAYELPG
jgi:pSer/pThr/pTyr-binding forkhead associated (FHA) protein